MQPDRLREWLSMDIAMTMRRRLRFSAASLLLLALACPAAAHAPHHHRKKIAARGFDGTYQVKITTTGGHGTCTANYSGTITIQNFRIVSLSDPQATASGGIEDDGTVSLAFRKDGQTANVGGRIMGGFGKGFWSSPTAYCGGLWRAERQ
jgi:hypothetical protein